MSSNSHLTLYQETGFFSFEFFWIHAIFEHNWPSWLAWVALSVGVTYARYGTLWATDEHNKKVYGEPAEWRRLAWTSLLVAAVMAPPYRVLQFILFCVK